MKASIGPGRSNLRQFALYAVITLVPVLALGLGLAASFRAIAQNHGLAQGRAEAALIARTAIEPQLDGAGLSSGLSVRERAGIQHLVRRVVLADDVLRLRLRGLDGRVVFSGDGSGVNAKPEDEALSAANGRVVSRLTRLNSDNNDHGGQGEESVEVYLPLAAGVRPHRVGVLEIYLPYAPIARDVNAALHSLYLDIGAGLGALYIILFAITLSVSRGLRREVTVNAHLANHDPLTDLPNRSLFLARARHAVAGTENSRLPVAIAIIDLDHFKHINDTLGHSSGDELLAKLAERVRLNMRPGDTVARLGGDEFGLILVAVADPLETLRRLRSVIAREMDVRGLSLSVEPSIGYVTASETGADVDTLLQHADVAMYAAKARHAGVLGYERELDQYDSESLSLVAELRHAIAANQLVMHYQPQCDIAGGRVTAIEALVRWEHPVHGLLSPDRFLPLAEQTDIINPLTDHILRTALAETKSFAEPDREIALAINVSARNIVTPGFASRVLRALADSGAPATRLIIEVTETALLTDPDRAVVALTELSAAGVRISLDDFGRGQTSLSYLSTLPAHELKIDRSFISDMQQNPAHSAIVRSVIDLGHNLSMRVVAEGVETGEVLDALDAYGCDVAQGFFLARPMPADALAVWLATFSGLRGMADWT